MGLLDDAIRDHLELKRRHGADPSEVAQQEQEALGPARRDEDEAEPAPEAGGARAFDFESEPAPASTGARAYDFEAEDEYDPQPGDRVEETTDEEEPLYDEDLTGDEDLDEDELPADAPRAHRDEGPAIDPELAEERRRAEERRGAEEQPRGDEQSRGDDVLEETPQFLQETPEHDRLWFEQKPPRDFDF